MVGLWGTRCTRHSTGVVLTVFAPAHRVDPASAVAYTRLPALMRMLLRHPDLASWVQAVRAHYSAHGTSPPAAGDHTPNERRVASTDAGALQRP